MGKKRVIKKGGNSEGGRGRNSTKAVKRKLDSGILVVNASFNNTMLTLSDMNGNVVAASSSGALGFNGSKKGTPYAASKVGELIAEKAEGMGIKEVAVVVKGVGAGRESSIRAFIAKNMVISSIKDATPVPFNGPKPPRPRRV
jgi:small subunit ribosomal protein S11